MNFANRYAKDGSGNHIEILRKREVGMPVSQRTCSKCKQHKSMKGGTNHRRIFICKSCNELEKK